MLSTFENHPNSFITGCGETQIDGNCGAPDALLNWFVGMAQHVAFLPWISGLRSLTKRLLNIWLITQIQI